MALTSRIGEGVLARFKQRNCIISSDEKTVIVSATMDLTDSYSVSVSNYQIENGTNITDHAHPAPPIISITCILSNDDFDYTNPANLLQDTAEQVKDTLIEFATQAKKLEVRYRDNVYTDYLINSASFTKSTEVGDNYNGSLTFQKIFTSTAQTGTIVKGKTPVQAKPVRKSILKGVFG